MYCGTFITGDTNSDDSKFLPFNDNYMKYNDELQMYVLTHAAYVNFVGKSPQSEYENFQAAQEDIWSAKQSRNIYRQLFISPYNPDHSDIVRFKIARTSLGRKTIFNALVSQSDWVLNFDKDLLEEGISPNAKDDLIAGLLWHQGPYAYCVDPDELNVGY